MIVYYIFIMRASIIPDIVLIVGMNKQVLPSLPRFAYNCRHDEIPSKAPVGLGRSGGAKAGAYWSGRIPLRPLSDLL